MKTKLAGIVFLGFLASLASAQVVSTNQNLPPLNGEYMAAGPITFGSGSITLNNLTLEDFTANTAPPATVGPTVNSFFDIFTEVSLNGGSSTLDNTPAPDNIQITLASSGGGQDTFNTQMTEMNISGLPNGDMLRVSPTLPSTGQATTTDLGGGQFQITSFFDVFTEISLDGGNTWTPNDGGSTRMNLEPLPEPSTVALAMFGVGIWAWRCKRKPASGTGS